MTDETTSPLFSEMGTLAREEYDRLESDLRECGVLDTLTQTWFEAYCIQWQHYETVRRWIEEQDAAGETVSEQMREDLRGQYFELVEWAKQSTLPVQPDGRIMLPSDHPDVAILPTAGFEVKKPDLDDFNPPFNFACSALDHLERAVTVFQGEAEHWRSRGVKGMTELYGNLVSLITAEIQAREDDPDGPEDARQYRLTADLTRISDDTISAAMQREAAMTKSLSGSMSDGSIRLLFNRAQGVVTTEIVRRRREQLKWREKRGE